MFKRLEDVARQKATLAQNLKWSDIENLPRPDKLVFETWNAIPDTYMNMKKYAFGVLSIFGSTYACEQLFSTMNYIKNKHLSRLTDDSLQSSVKMKVTSYSPICRRCAQRCRSRSSINAARCRTYLEAQRRNKDNGSRHFFVFVCYMDCLSSAF